MLTRRDGLRLTLGLAVTLAGGSKAGLRREHTMSWGMYLFAAQLLISGRGAEQCRSWCGA